MNWTAPPRLDRLDQSSHPRMIANFPTQNEVAICDFIAGKFILPETDLTDSIQYFFL